jgi:hypothetical protein
LAAKIVIPNDTRFSHLPTFVFMRTGTAVLVLSYDGNRDMWLPFFQFFEKYWSGCPYPIYLVVNEFDFQFQGIQVIKTGAPSDWSSELRCALHQIPEENLIVMLEDYFIYAPVNEPFVVKSLAVMEVEGADYLRLGTFPSRYDSLWPSVPVPNYSGFNKIRPEAKYLVNLQAAIWKKQTLLDILLDGESPWSFEINASRRFAEAGKVALGLDPKANVDVVHGPIMYLCGALTRGVLMRSAIRLANKEGIRLDTGVRKVESVTEEWMRRFYIALPLPARKVYLAAINRFRKIFNSNPLKK